MVIPEGLEPPTYRLGICRSILMSYGITMPICLNSAAIASVRAKLYEKAPAPALSGRHRLLIDKLPAKAHKSA